MLPDIVDASRTVRPEQKSEYLTDKIGIYSAISYVIGTFGAGVVALTLDASPYPAPGRLFIFMATGAFPR